jgi:hypothetical protein
LAALELRGLKEKEQPVYHTGERKCPSCLSPPGRLAKISPPMLFIAACEGVMTPSPIIAPKQVPLRWPILSWPASPCSPSKTRPCSPSTNADLFEHLRQADEAGRTHHLTLVDPTTQSLGPHPQLFSLVRAQQHDGIAAGSGARHPTATTGVAGLVVINGQVVNGCVTKSARWAWRNRSAAAAKTPRFQAFPVSSQPVAPPQTISFLTSSCPSA